MTGRIRRKGLAGAVCCLVFVGTPWANAEPGDLRIRAGSGGSIQNYWTPDRRGGFGMAWDGAVFVGLSDTVMLGPRFQMLMASAAGPDGSGMESGNAIVALNPEATLQVREGEWAFYQLGAGALWVDGLGGPSLSLAGGADAPGPGRSRLGLVVRTTVTYLIEPRAAGLTTVMGFLVEF